MNTEKVRIPDQTLAGIIVRNGYLKESEMDDCLKLQIKLSKNSVEKNLEDIFLYKKLLPDSELKKLSQFMHFVQSRFASIILCDIALQQDFISQEDIERVLITQRSIFALKATIVSLEQLLELKGILSAENNKKIVEISDSLSEEEFRKLVHKSLELLDKEDIEAVRWRTQHLKGIVGTKYASTNTGQPSGLLNIFKKKTEPSSGKELPGWLEKSRGSDQVSSPEKPSQEKLPGWLGKKDASKTYPNEAPSAISDTTLKEDAVSSSVTNSPQKNDENLPFEIPPAKSEGDSPAHKWDASDDQVEIPSRRVPEENKSEDDSPAHKWDASDDQVEIPARRVPEENYKVQESEIPPVRSSRTNSEENIIVKRPENGDVLEIGATEAFLSPEPPKHSSNTKIAFWITAVVCVVAFALVLIFNRQEMQMFKEIEQLRTNNAFVELEEKCRKFHVSYPKGERSEKVVLWLQEVLIKKADIAQRQKNLDEARKIVLEALTLGDKGNISEQIHTLLQEIEKEILYKQKQERFTRDREEIQALIQQKDFAKAKHTLQQMQTNLEEGKQTEIWDSLNKQVARLEEEQKVGQYHYYGANDLPSAIPAMFRTEENKGLERILLQGKDSFYESDILAETLKDSHQPHFFGIFAGYLYAINIVDGKVDWVRYLGSTSIFYPIFIAGPREYYNLALAEKVLVVSSSQNAILLLDARTGENVWERALPGIIAVQPVVYYGKVYIGCMDRYCYQLDILSGQIEGAYLAGSTPVHPPSFDKRKKWMFLPCTDRVYAYDLSTGKMTLAMPAPEGIAASAIGIYPYLIIPASKEGMSTIFFYTLQEKQPLWEARLMKSANVTGKIHTPPALAGGILAVATESHVCAFGINPSNPNEIFFPLGTLPMEERQPVFLQFANFMRNLMVLQKNFSLCTIQNFSSSSDALQITTQYHIPEESPLRTCLPLQRYNKLFFWIQHSKDNRYFQATCLKIEKQKITPVWQKQFGSVVCTDILKTSDGRLFLYSYEGNFHELYLDGQGKICYRPLSYRSGDSVPQPLYIPQDDGYLMVKKGRALVLLDAVTGYQKPWSPEIAIPGDIGSMSYAQETIFVGTDQGVFAFSFKNGKKRYIEYSEFKGKPFCSPAVLYKDSLLLGCDNGLLYQLKMSTGEALPFLQNIWAFQTQGAIRGKPLLVENIVYFGSEDHCLYAVDVANKKFLWKYQTGGTVKTPVLHNNILYFGSDDRCFYAVDAREGKHLWHKQFFGKVHATPLVHKDKIYVASMAGDFFAYELKTGSQVWEARLGSSIASSPVSLGNYILLPGMDGFIYVVKDE